MLKAKGIIQGRETYIIGLSWGNMDRFRAAPGDSYIRIPQEESGLSVDILIFSDRTEADMMKFVEDGIVSTTEVNISDRLKD
jgi:hypothetical protein